MQRKYVHGYSEIESHRLSDQAKTLDDLLHHDTAFPKGHKVLEAGCGTGAQTEILARRCPDALITAVDISEPSLKAAEGRLRRAGVDHVEFERADVCRLPYSSGYFDHILVCFLLEHLARPMAALTELKRVLAPGGTIVAIEGDHGSFYCYPETPEARRVVRCLVEIQAGLGGDALIGRRRLYPLLRQAGFHNIHVSPRVVYVDESRPDWEEGFSRSTFIAMVEAMAFQAVGQGLISKERWEKGIRDLHAATGPDTTFHYTFFKGVAQVSREI